MSLEEIHGGRRDAERRSYDYEKDQVSRLDEDDFVFGGGLVITNFLSIISGSYQDIVRRSFTTNISEDTQYRLADTMSSQGTDIVGLAEIASEMITPSAKIDAELEIQNGWDEPRITFILEFVTRGGSPGKGYLRYTYSGFTSHMGYDVDTGRFDDDMVLHITNATVSRVNERGLTNHLRNDSIHRSARHYANRNSTVGGREFAMDPSSVLLHGRAIELGESLDVTGEPIYPHQSSVSRKIRASSRNHIIPGHYMARVINTSIAFKEQDDLLSGMDDWMGSQNSTVVKQSRALQSNFANEDKLAQLFRDDGNFNQTGSITYRELREYFPAIESPEVARIILPSDVRQVDSREVMSVLRDLGEETLDSDQWHRANQETVIATAICQQLPSLMMSEFIESIRFHVSNDISSADWDECYAWTIGDTRRSARDNRDALWFMTDVPNHMKEKHLRSFQYKVESIILNNYTRRNLIGIDLTVDCTISEDCTVIISLDGGNDYKFVMPVFAESLASPLLTRDMDNYHQFASDIKTTLENI